MIFLIFLKATVVYRASSFCNKESYKSTVCLNINLFLVRNIWTIERDKMLQFVPPECLICLGENGSGCTTWSFFQWSKDLSDCLRSRTLRSTRSFRINQHGTRDKANIRKSSKSIIIINYFVFPRHCFEFDLDLFDFVNSNCSFMVGLFKILRKF